MPIDRPLSFAVVILAARASPSERDRVTEMVDIARAVGADAVVVAVPRGWRAPAHGRVVHAAPGATPMSVVRLAMAQLSNTPARYALLWPLAAPACDVERLRALVEYVERERPALAAMEGDDVERAPVMIARDAWLELMTLGEQDLAALGERLGVQRVVAY